MRNILTFEGSLVRQSELMTSKNGETKFLYLTLSRNYSHYDEKNKTWVNDGSIFQDVTLFNKIAENFAAARLKNGITLIVSGTTSFNPEREYTNKEGIQVKVEPKESILADAIGISFARNQVPTYVKPEYNNSGKQSAPAQQKSAPAKQGPAKQEEFSFFDDSLDDSSSSVEESIEDSLFGSDDDWEF